MILNGKPTNPGQLRTRITLKRRVVNKDAGGFPSVSTETITQVLSRWKNVHGSEVWAAEVAQAQQAATVLIRYRSDLDETCLVDKGGQLFEIVSIDNIEERSEYIELKVKRTVPG
ncbi:MAG: hypothetical protein CL609_23795 [Anaerolineaceae bacterium]|nr:hypothetical protein [Anaerolineaceae bacterium]